MSDAPKRRGQLTIHLGRSWTSPVSRGSSWKPPQSDGQRALGTGEVEIAASELRRSRALGRSPRQAKVDVPSKKIHAPDEQVKAY
jgi:hypothetical protein